MGSTTPTEQRLYILDAGFAHGQPYHGRILSTRTDGSDPRTLVDHLATLPDGIAIDRAHGHMYWTNMGTSFKTDTGSIERADLDGSHRTIILGGGEPSSSQENNNKRPVGLFTPKQITIAPRARKLYWCDREGMKVMRANMDGSSPEVLVSTGDAASESDRLDQRRWCVGIAVDELRGWFYWTQKGPSKGGRGRILRAPVDAPDMIEVVFDDLPEPIDLHLDEAAQTLYWTDRGDPPQGNTLNRAAVGLGGQKQVLAMRLHETIGLALDRDADVVYVTDLAGGVYSVDIKKRIKKVLFAELGDLTGIALV